MTWTRRYVLVAVLSLGWGCDEGTDQRAQMMADVERPPGDYGVEVDSTAEDGAVVPADAAPDAEPPPACVDDLECAEQTVCDETGACVAGPPETLIPVQEDGVSRAGVAAFDITPSALEPWTDRAGPECPENRPGRFDGRIDEPTPADPCADGFEDVDGDGAFDAVWLAGEGTDRPALGVDNENAPRGRVLVLSHDATRRVLVTLDVYAMDAARVADLQRRVAMRLGIDPGEILIHATGTHGGPDAVGLEGPSLARAGQGLALERRLGEAIGLLSSIPARSGTSEAWFQELVPRTAAAAAQAASAAAPAELRAAVAELPMRGDEAQDGPIELPDADEDGRLNTRADLEAWRRRPVSLVEDPLPPSRRDRHVRALELRGMDGEAFAYLLSWGAASGLPEPVLSAGFPGYVRRSVEEARPGSVALWLGGLAADSVVAGRAFVPQVDEQGRPIDDKGDPVAEPELAAPAAEPVKALGQLLARRGLAALEEAEAAPMEFAATARFAWVPLSNPRFGIAARLGLLPHLEGWLSGLAPTNAWASGETAPACGGLGCLRYRLERLDLGPVALLTFPGAPEDAYARGQLEAGLDLSEERNLRDLDGDGVEDEVDPEIRAQLRGQGRELMVDIPGPANPQRFPAVQGLEQEGLWLIGRTNGGVGTLAPQVSHLNVFEGTLQPLVEYAKADENAQIVLCQLGFPCTDGLTLGQLAELTLDAQPHVLADLPGAHEAEVEADLGEEEECFEGPWQILDPEGALRVEGVGIMLGPGRRVFAPQANLVEAGVQPGDSLIVEAREPVLMGAIVPVELRRHPNAGDAWRAAAGGGGDFVYNTACQLLFDGACPNRRGIFGDDPNQTLPRTP